MILDVKRMPKIALSDTGLRSLKAPAKGTADYWDKSLPSFGVRISQGGTKTFVLNLDKARRKIGRFPVLSLADARTEAKRILAERTLGRVRPQSISFQSALELFLAEKTKSRRASTADNHRDRLTRHFPFKCQISEITHAEVARRLAKIPTNAEHDHALSVAKTFLHLVP
jgi:Arm DNA-binding domain